MCKCANPCGCNLWSRANMFVCPPQSASMNPNIPNHSLHRSRAKVCVQCAIHTVRPESDCKEENSFGLGVSKFFPSNLFLDIVLCVLEGTHPPCISREIPRQVAALFPFSQEIPPTSPSTSPALYIFPASSNFSWFPPNSHPPHFNNTPLYYVSCLLKWFLILPFSREISLFPNLLYPVSPNFPLIFFQDICQKSPLSNVWKLRP